MVSNVSSSPQPQPIQSARLGRPSIKASPEGSGAIKSAPNADSFKQTKFQGHKQAKFGGDGPGAVRKGLAWTLGLGSAAVATVAVPLGLTQMALGLFLHPLMITGALTLAVPAVGALGTYLLARK